MRKVQFLKGQEGSSQERGVVHVRSEQLCNTLTPVRCGDMVTVAALTESAVGLQAGGSGLGSEVEGPQCGQCHRSFVFT